MSTRCPLTYEVPQGAILSWMLINIYMHLLAQLVQNFRVRCYQYAVDTQMYLLMDSHPDTTPQNLAGSLGSLVGRLKKSQLNLTKTEVLWLGDASGLGHRLSSLDRASLTPTQNQEFVISPSGAFFHHILFLKVF